MQSDVSTIKDRLNIVDVVGEYVRLTKAGANYKACCPFHGEKTPSFVVTEERGTYHCFGCGKGGDILAFIMEIESLEFRDALQILADRAGVELQKFTPKQQKSRDERALMQSAMEQSVTFYMDTLRESQEGKKVTQYLQDRGISKETAEKLNLGYAPNDWHKLENFFQGQGSKSHGQTYDNATLVGAGLLIQKDGGGVYDRFRGRLMFPISDRLGKPVGYSARALPTITGEDESGAKYINTPETPLYHKSDILYGIHLAKSAIRHNDRVLLVEGNMDVVACHEAGIENVVAVSGTALTESHIKILKTLTNKFTLFFDADAAGKSAARSSAQMCLANDIDVMLVTLEGGKDAADIVAEDPQKLSWFVSQASNSLSYFISDAKASLAKEKDQSPHAKRLAIESVLEMASYVAHPLERDEWIAECAKKFDIDSVHARDVVDKFNKEKLKPGAKTSKAKEEVTTTKSVPTFLKKTSVNDAKRSPLDQITSHIIQLSLAFPVAWHMLADESEKSSQGQDGAVSYDHPVLREGAKLKSFIAFGQKHNYDPHDYIEQTFGANSSEKVAYISSYREKYLRERDDDDDAHREIIRYIQRASDLYKKQQLDEFISKRTQAKRDGNTEDEEKYTKRIRELTT